jgi:hypothetical protein
MFFSDALYPRTYVGQNAIDPPGGAIYGLHVNAGGALIVCTTTGVYALPEDAAASGQIVIGVFSKLTDHQTIKYKTTAVCKGMVFGLTKRGYQRIDQAGADEFHLDEKVNSVGYLSGSQIGRIAFNDYRDGAIYGGQESVFVHMPNKTLHVYNIGSGLMSWWVGTTSTVFSVFGGLGFDNDGSEVYLVNGICQARGNNASSFETTLPEAMVIGRINLPPDASPVIRWVTFASDSFNDFKFFIRDAVKSLTPKRYSPIVGTDTWEGGSKYIEARLQSRQSDWSIRGDDLVFVLSVKEHPALIPKVIDVVFKGPGKQRPT